ncbi:2-C-methyl-D-erythritol 4-phosphate cytidylyltransferase [Pseudonocardia sp. TRM90224]|uniref:2-C-methyl-D-erythritol 4-phosphate cytidylyltransferase n=1 Tax=Pseudonocardia sp. TRM90224 TaxID=2812678 RepID=UPI001E39A56B|nr:2-C-methyl-D-erythritol 4-phosphate cytidylyltransferase [Pseudonocardia sp. TRM90224]
MTVAAVVVVGSRAGALDELTPIAGVPMLVHTVRGLFAAGIPTVQVMVGVHAALDAVELACVDLRVDVRASNDPRRVGARPDQRSARTDGDGSLTIRPDDVVLVHDAARPLAPSSLVGAVIEAVVSGHDVVVPVLPLVDTVKVVDDDGLIGATPDRAGLRVIQAPHAYRARVLTEPLGADALELAAARAAAGRPVHTVAGEPLAFAVTTAWELQLAEAAVEERGA